MSWIAFVIMVTWRGLRSKLSEGSSEDIRRLVIAFGRLNSRSPSAPWMHPNPESPTPPKGSEGWPTKEIAELTEVIPERTFRALTRALVREFVHYDDRSGVDATATPWSPVAPDAAVFRRAGAELVSGTDSITASRA